jgi:hypothetical protein
MKPDVNDGRARPKDAVANEKRPLSAAAAV